MYIYTYIYCICISICILIYIYPNGRYQRSLTAGAPSGMLSEGGTHPDGFSPQLTFFKLVRDTIASVPQELAPAEYVRKQVAILNSIYLSIYLSIHPSIYLYIYIYMYA